MHIIFHLYTTCSIFFFAFTENRKPRNYVSYTTVHGDGRVSRKSAIVNPHIWDVFQKITTGAQILGPQVYDVYRPSVFVWYLVRRLLYCVLLTESFVHFRFSIFSYLDGKNDGFRSTEWWVIRFCDVRFFDDCNGVRRFWRSGFYYVSINKRWNAF